MSQPHLARDVYESRENHTIVQKTVYFVGTKLRLAKSVLTTITIVVLEHLLAAKLDQQSPFSDEATLRNIITGINADTNVSVQKSEPFHRGHRRGDEHGRASCVLVFAQTHECTEDTSINQSRHSR